jgi:hypothetical protein
MSTGKTIAIVAGVGIGAFLLLRVIVPSSPSTSARPPGSSASAGTSLLGLLPSALSGLGGLINSSNSSGGGSTTFNAGVAQGSFESASDQSIAGGTGYGDQAAVLGTLFPGLL